MTSGDERLLVLAAIDGVGNLPEPVVERTGDERAFTVIAAAATAAIQRKFAAEPDAAAIQDFIQRLKGRFPDGAHLIKPIVAEALIRGAFGHEELLDGVDPDDVQSLLFVLPYAIMSHENLDGSARDEFVNEALALAG